MLNLALHKLKSLKFVHIYCLVLGLMLVAFSFVAFTAWPTTDDTLRGARILWSPYGRFRTMMWTWTRELAFVNGTYAHFMLHNTIATITNVARYQWQHFLLLLTFIAAPVYFFLRVNQYVVIGKWASVAVGLTVSFLVLDSAFLANTFLWQAAAINFPLVFAALLIFFGNLLVPQKLWLIGINLLLLFFINGSQQAGGIVLNIVLTYVLLYALIKKNWLYAMYAVVSYGLFLVNIYFSFTTRIENQGLYSIAVATFIGLNMGIEDFFARQTVTLILFLFLVPSIQKNVDLHRIGLKFPWLVVLMSVGLWLGAYVLIAPTRMLGERRMRDFLAMVTMVNLSLTLMYLCIYLSRVKRLAVFNKAGLAVFALYLLAITVLPSRVNTSNFFYLARAFGTGRIAQFVHMQHHVHELLLDPRAQQIEVAPIPFETRLSLSVLEAHALNPWLQNRVSYVYSKESFLVSHLVYPQLFRVIATPIEIAEKAGLRTYNSLLTDTRTVREFVVDFVGISPPDGEAFLSIVGQGLALYYHTFGLVDTYRVIEGQFTTSVDFSEFAEGWYEVSLVVGERRYIQGGVEVSASGAVWAQS